MGRSSGTASRNDQSVVDEAMLEKWWQLHVGGYSNRVIHQRFGVSVHAIGKYIKQREQPAEPL